MPYIYRESCDIYNYSFATSFIETSAYVHRIATIFSYSHIFYNWLVATLFTPG
jgi:hypothetical protein